MPDGCPCLVRWWWFDTPKNTGKLCVGAVGSIYGLRNTDFSATIGYSNDLKVLQPGHVSLCLCGVIEKRGGFLLWLELIEMMCPVTLLFLPESIMDSIFSVALIQLWGGETITLLLYAMNISDVSYRRVLRTHPLLHFYTYLPESCRRKTMYFGGMRLSRPFYVWIICRNFTVVCLYSLISALNLARHT